MQSHTESETDRTAGVEPPIEPAVPWRVRNVRVIEHGLLDVQFVDDTRGTVDLRQFLLSDKVVGTMFEPLRDSGLFAKVAIHLGAVEWPGEIDLAPEVMYDAIRLEGHWTPGR
jgi:hypothetical protein